jgi:uncharacterized membrane protein YdjX (TVP38/TMEM64 family)
MKQALLIALIVALASWIVQARYGPLPPWAEQAIEMARAEFHQRPMLTVILFCLAHVFAAIFSIPGSCTALNVTSGAVFGFWLGCAIVYPITLFSGCLGYFAASKLRTWGILRKYEAHLERMREQVGLGSFLILVTLRLNPFVPYGVLNPALGLLGVPFGAFLASTFVGIFLDVVLLNSAGATLASAGRSEGMAGWKVLVGFLAVMATFGCARWLAKKMNEVKG